MARQRSCSGCVACCRLPFRGKPGGGRIGVLCKHAVPGVGCKIHHKRRLAVCTGFDCPWLLGITRTRPSDLGALVYWSPDRSHGPGDRFTIATICVILEPGMAFNRAVKAEVRRLAGWLARGSGATNFVVDTYTPDNGGQSHCEFWIKNAKGKIGKAPPIKEW